MTDTTTNQTTPETPEDTHTSPGGAQEPAEVPAVPEATTETHEPQEEPPEDDGNREAAKYRRRLRDTEADRDRLATQVEALQRAEVNRLALAEDVKPEALWASGAQLAELLTTDGTVDPTRVTVAARSAIDILGLQQRKGNHVPREGRNTGTPKPKEPTFADAFNPATRT